MACHLVYITLLIVAQCCSQLGNQHPLASLPKSTLSGVVDSIVWKTKFFKLPILPQ